MNVPLLQLDAESYMLAADAAFWDRSDPRRVFVGRIVSFGTGFVFVPPNTYVDRRWSCSILVRAAKYEPRRLGEVA